MAKYGIDTKAKKIALIINPPKDQAHFSEGEKTKLQSWLTLNADVYAFILHDLDVTEDGEAKRDHIHVYAEMTACSRLVTNLNKLADWLGYDNQQISIEKATNPTGVIQYLIHKNDPEKHQYQATEIVTNLSKPDLDAILNSSAGNCSLSFFKSCVSRCNGNRWNLIEMIGLDVYKEYRLVILDLFNSLYKGA